MRKVCKFSNGAVLLYRKNKLSKATVMRFGITRGGALDNNTGLSHLLEHMLFKGTTTKTKEQLDEDIRQNVNSINAATASNYLVIFFHESSKNFEKALEITSDCFLNSNFPKVELEKEKQVVLQEIIRDKDNTDRQAYRNMWKSAYDYPEEKSYTLGDENKMLKLTQEQLLKYKENNFISENFIVSVTSNLSYFKVKSLVKKYLINHLKSGVATNFTPYNFTINGNSKLTYEYVDRNKVKIYVGFPTVGFYDLKNNFVAGLIPKYLNVLKSPLWKYFREKNQLTYAQSVSRGTYKDDGLMYFSIETSPNNVNACFDALGELFAELKKGIPLEEVKRLQRNYKQFKDCFVGYPPNFCADDMYEYLGHNRLIKNREFKFEKKLIKKENIDKALNNLLNFDKVFISVSGKIKKEEIYPLNKIISVLKGKKCK